VDERQALSRGWPSIEDTSGAADRALLRGRSREAALVRARGSPRLVDELVNGAQTRERRYRRHHRPAASRVRDMKCPSRLGLGKSSGKASDRLRRSRIEANPRRPLTHETSVGRALTASRNARGQSGATCHPIGDSSARGRPRTAQAGFEQSRGACSRAVSIAEVGERRVASRRIPGEELGVREGLASLSRERAEVNAGRKLGAPRQRRADEWRTSWKRYSSMKGALSRTTHDR